MGEVSTAIDVVLHFFLGTACIQYQQWIRSGNSIAGRCIRLRRLIDHHIPSSASLRRDVVIEDWLLYRHFVMKPAIDIHIGYSLNPPARIRLNVRVPFHAGFSSSNHLPALSHALTAPYSAMSFSDSTYRYSWAHKHPLS